MRNRISGCGLCVAASLLSATTGIAAAVPSAAEDVVLVGAGKTRQGAHWRVYAYRYADAVETEVKIRARGARYRLGGPPPDSPECGDIGAGTYMGDTSESVFTGPISQEVGVIRARFRRDDGELFHRKAQIERVSSAQAARLGLQRRFGWFVSAAPVDVNELKAVTAKPYDRSDDAPLTGKARFAGTTLGCR
jgi:hypothetical protein